MNITPTGNQFVDFFAIWGAAFVGITGAVALFWRLLSGVRRIFTRIDEFIDDWQGTQARPGHPGQSGVMARLERIEHELSPNSGESLRDAVNRIEAQVTSSPSTATVPPP